MRYFLAIFLPPLAVLLCGRIFAAILNLFLCVLGVIPGIIHALSVVSSHKSDQRNSQQIQAIEAQTAAIQAQTRAQLQQSQEIASAQLRATVEASAVVAASNLATVPHSPGQQTGQPRQLVQPVAIETTYSVARDGEVFGEYTWTEIQQYLADGQMLPTDHYFNGSDWVTLTQSNADCLWRG